MQHTAYPPHRFETVEELAEHAAGYHGDMRLVAQRPDGMSVEVRAVTRSESEVTAYRGGVMSSQRYATAASSEAIAEAIAEVERQEAERVTRTIRVREGAENAVWRTWTTYEISTDDYRWQEPSDQVVTNLARDFERDDPNALGQGPLWVRVVDVTASGRVVADRQLHYLDAWVL